MSQEDVEAVRNAFARFGAVSLEEAAETSWDPDVEYVEDPRWPGAARYRGREAVLSCFQGYLEALGPIDASAITVEQVIDAGARQVPFVRFRGRSPSGIPHEHVWGFVVESTDGRITYFRAYYDPDEALEAARSLESDRGSRPRNGGSHEPG